MSALEITRRYAATLSAQGLPPPGAPDWINEIDNPYLHGLFAPQVHEVERTPLELVAGEIPPDLQGAYLRNSPNPRQAPINRYHWFDGDGMVQGVWFGDGRAEYASRWIETRGMQMERERGAAIWPGVLGPFDFQAPLFPIKDTANTDLVWHDGKLLALWYECGRPVRLDEKTLATLGEESFAGQLDIPISAHAHTDPLSGDLVFFRYADQPPYFQHGVLDAQGGLHLQNIELPGPRRPHDIGITPNYSIIHDFPLFHDDAVFRATGRRIPLFHPDVPTRFGILPRFGSNADVRWFECQPCYMLHVVNCWEDGDRIVMTGCRTRDPSLHPDPNDGKLASMLAYLKLQANLYRWEFDLQTGAVREGDLDDLNAEFPMIRDSCLGQQNRYAYLQDLPCDIPARFEGVIKYDLRDGRACDRYAHGPGVYGSESPFAPRIGGDGEDDGYLLTLTTDTADWNSYCLVLDARDLAAGPVAKLRLPQRVTAGFHTTWVPGSG